jgi:hypothetical protein
MRPARSRWTCISRYATTPEIVSAPIFDKQTFDLKLFEMGIHNDIAEIVTRSACHRNSPQRISKQGIDNLRRSRGIAPENFRKTVDAIGWLAHSNYIAVFPPDCPVSERVIFPVSETRAAVLKTHALFASSTTMERSPITRPAPHSMDSKSCRR